MEYERIHKVQVCFIAAQLHRDMFIYVYGGFVFLVQFLHLCSILEGVCVVGIGFNCFSQMGLWCFSH